MLTARRALQVAVVAGTAVAGTALASVSVAQPLGAPASVESPPTTPPPPTISQEQGGGTDGAADLVAFDTVRGDGGGGGGGGGGGSNGTTSDQTATGATAATVEVWPQCWTGVTDRRDGIYVDEDGNELPQGLSAPVKARQFGYDPVAVAEPVHSVGVRILVAWYEACQASEGAATTYRSWWAPPPAAIVPITLVPDAYALAVSQVLPPVSLINPPSEAPYRPGSGWQSPTRASSRPPRRPRAAPSHGPPQPSTPPRSTSAPTVR